MAPEEEWHYLLPCAVARHAKSMANPEPSVN